MRYAERGGNGRSFVVMMMDREHAAGDVSVVRCIVDRSCGVHAVVHERASAVTPESGAQMTHECHRLTKVCERVDRRNALRSTQYATANSLTLTF